MGVQLVLVPFCLTLTMEPAMVITPVRDKVDVLAATLTATVPLPEPLLPLAIVSQAVPLVAVQLQPLPVVTEKLVDPAAAATVLLVGLTVAVQPELVPLCTTDTPCPATVSVPLRCAPPELAATE